MNFHIDTDKFLLFLNLPDNEVINVIPDDAVAVAGDGHAVTATGDGNAAVGGIDNDIAVAAAGDSNAVAAAGVDDSDAVVVADDGNADQFPKLATNDIIAPMFDDGVNVVDVPPPSRPLTVRRVQFQRRVGLPNLGMAARMFRDFDRQMATGNNTGINEMERMRTDLQRQIDNRNRDSNRRIARIRDEAVRKRLGDKLKEAVTRSKAAIDQFINEQKVELRKLLDSTAGDFTKNGMESIEKMMKSQSAGIATLTALGPKMHVDIQSKFADAGRVMDEIMRQAP